MTVAARPRRDVRAEGGPVLRRLAANALSLFLAWLLPRLCLAAAIIVAARVLGAERFGAYGTAAAFAVILSLVATLGMQPLLVREIARAPERAASLLRAADAIKVGAGLLMLLLLPALAAILQYSAEVTWAALLLGVAYAVGAFVENRAARVQAEERMMLWTRASAIAGLVTGVAGIVLIGVTRSVVWFCAAPLLGQVTALTYFRLRAPIARSGFSTQDVRRLAVALLPFAAAFIALTLHAKVAVLLLAQWRDAADVGVFVAGYKFIDLAQAMLIVLVGAAYPRLSRSHGQEVGAWRAGARLSELLLLIATPAAAALWLARGPAVSLLFGSGYASAVPVAGLLAASMPALAINVAGIWVLGAAGRMGAVVPLYVGAVALDIALCALWVPAHGATGAAAALLASEWILAATMFAVLHRAAHVRARAIVLVCAAAVALLSGLSVLLPDPTGGVARAVLVLGAALALYPVAGAITREDRQLLRDAVRSRRRAAA